MGVAERGVPFKMAVEVSEGPTVELVMELASEVSVQSNQHIPQDKTKYSLMEKVELQDELKKPRLPHVSPRTLPFSETGIYGRSSTGSSSGIGR